MAEEFQNTPPGHLPEDDDRRDLFPPEEAPGESAESEAPWS